jgi:probable F420-dependent oxidoreductase
MRIGVIVPNAGDTSLALGVATMAKAAEEAGAQSLWVSDHLLQVDEDTTDYPYAPDGRPSWGRDIPYLEAFTCCAFMAAATEKCRIGTAVLVLPQRNVFEVAKIAATLDQLSRGRFVLGVGAGWYRHEFEALGYSYDDRGRRMNEMLETLRDCWTGRPAPFTGTYVRVRPNLVLAPPPVQEPGPPLLVGGMTESALVRAARHGDGWLALAYAPSLGIDELRASLDRLAALRADSGRAGSFELVLKLHAGQDEVAELYTALSDARKLGFEEVAIEPPWANGLDAAAAVITEASARAA